MRRHPAVSRAPHRRRSLSAPALAQSATSPEVGTAAVPWRPLQGRCARSRRDCFRTSQPAARSGAACRSRRQLHRSSRLSSAPCRRSPASSRSRNSCSSAVARPNSARKAVARRALEPVPRIAARSSSRRSTSMRSRLAVSAGPCAQARNVDGPMPIRPWRISPARYSTAISSSSAFSARRPSASSRALADREDVLATSRDTATTVASNVMAIERKSRVIGRTGPIRVLRRETNPTARQASDDVKLREKRE